RGISVTSSVMNFPYQGYEVNILDTPGHDDFSEDTYRTLTAVDSVVMIIDSTKGIEPQTIKLFKVCRMRGIPIFTFINKLDREGKEPFSLLEEIERFFTLAIQLINKSKDRNTTHAAYFKQFYRLWLDSFGRINNHDHAVYRS